MEELEKIEVPAASFCFRGLVSFDPIGRPIFFFAIGPVPSAKVLVARFQVRCFQMSRTVLSLMPYRFATNNALDTITDIEFSDLNLNISIACCSVRIARCFCDRCCCMALCTLFQMGTMK